MNEYDVGYHDYLAEVAWLDEWREMNVLRCPACGREYHRSMGCVECAEENDDERA